jgi:hypothetical protein
VLLGGCGEEPPDAVGLPIRGLHDLGQGRSLGPADQRQYFRALALGAWCAGFFDAGGLSHLLAGRGFLLGRGLRFSTLGGVLALGRALLLAGTLLQGGLLRRDCRALFRNGGGCGGGFCVLHCGLCPFGG